MMFFANARAFLKLSVLDLRQREQIQEYGEYTTRIFGEGRKHEEAIEMLKMSENATIPQEIRTIEIHFL